jgi:hypothetical protein
MMLPFSAIYRGEALWLRKSFSRPRSAGGGEFIWLQGKEGKQQRGERRGKQSEE